MIQQGKNDTIMAFKFFNSIQLPWSKTINDMVLLFFSLIEYDCLKFQLHWCHQVKQLSVLVVLNNQKVDYNKEVTR